MGKQIIVLAGDIRQFTNYKKQIRDSIIGENDIIIYGWSVDAISCVLPDEVITVGTFWDREDAGRIYYYAKRRQETKRRLSHSAG